MAFLDIFDEPFIFFILGSVTQGRISIANTTNIDTLLQARQQVPVLEPVPTRWGGGGGGGAKLCVFGTYRRTRKNTNNFTFARVLSKTSRKGMVC
jgi:hypothetical protein